MDNRRIGLLDSFRCIAVLGVLLYHFTWRWGLPAFPVNMYPFGSFFGGIFRYGYLGVEFFFIISGFVISYTLENSRGPAAFLKNRFIRLFPPMLLCSLLTWLVAGALDDKGNFPPAHQVINFLPSLTFINPKLWNLLIPKNFAWINGSYWSLWTEVQFYVLAALVYFSDKKNFFRNILLLTIGLSLEKYIPAGFLHFYPGDRLPSGWRSFFGGWKFLDEEFNITFFIAWFMTGIFFHHLYKRFSIRLGSLNGIGMSIVFFYLLVTSRGFMEMFFFLLMTALFLLMIYNKSYLSFLERPLFRRIGIVSYSIYLIHETIGILLMNKYGGWLGSWSPLSLPIIMLGIILFAELSYRYYEKKISGVFKN